jgi:hypothetical protein
MTYFNPDGLYRKYGTEKAVPTTGGTYAAKDALRDMEVTVDLTTLTTTRSIVADITQLPSGMFIEEVDVITDVAAVGGTSFNIGLINYDRITVISDTALVAGLPTANVTPAGKKTILTAGVTGAGVNVGTLNPAPALITASATGTFTAGLIKIRILFRGYGTITQ